MKPIKKLASTNAYNKKLSESMVTALNKAATPLPTNKHKSVNTVQETPTRKYKSRFFYTLQRVESEVAANIERQKELTAASRRIVQEVEEHTGSRVASYTPELQDMLHANVEEVREFFLRQINPLILASSLGAAQAKDVLEKMLNANIDPEPYQHFERMIRKAALAKLSRFVCEYLDLPLEDLRLLLEKPTTTEIILPDVIPRERNTKPVS